MATYTIQVFTGDRQYADTRAKVYLTLNGSYGIQGEIPLEGEFKRGERRTFTVEWDLYGMYKLCGDWKTILIDFSPELIPACLGQNQCPQT
jgi:hypothetical protein